MRTEKIALHIIRFGAAGTMLVHGVARIVNAGVTPFDGFLTGIGFPAYTAWVITIFEIGAALALLLNKWVSVICILFILQLLMGIILVHGREGWFVVGAGRNGVEYSVLLILCFVSTALASRKSH